MNEKNTLFVAVYNNGSCAALYMIGRTKEKFTIHRRMAKNHDTHAQLNQHLFYHHHRKGTVIVPRYVTVI